MRDENAFARALLRVNQQNETTVWCNFPVRRCSNPYILASNRDNTTMFVIMSVSSLFLLWMLATNYTRTLNLFKVLLRCLSCLIVPLRFKMIANHKNNTAHTYHYTPKTIDFRRNMKIRWWLTTWKWSSSWQSKSFFSSQRKNKTKLWNHSVCMLFWIWSSVKWWGRMTQLMIYANTKFHLLKK